MAQTLIRGSTQIQAGTVPWTAMSSGAIVPTASLVDGANFLKKDGSVSLTADFNAGGFKLTNLAAGISGTDAMTLAQGQALINGLSNRRVRVIATTNLTLSGIQNIDGITGVAADRVLAKGQTTTSQNGPWVQSAGAWTRPTDWAAASAQKSTMFYVEEGSTNQDTKWLVITDAITVDTTGLTINQDSSGTTYTNGTGLSLAGNVFSVNYGTTSTTAAVGNDSRITGALQTSALGTNVQTALGVAVGSAGAVVLNGGALGTPSSGTLTSCTGLPTTSLTGALAAAQFPALTGDVITTAGSLATTVNHTISTGFFKYTDMVFSETPSGAINGVNTTFTIANTPATGFGSVNSLEVFLNGVLLESGAGNDYTVSGTTITMLLVPQTSDKLRVCYNK